MDQFHDPNLLQVVTSQVQETVHVFVGLILAIIFAFLAAHLFIRYHYKAKTDYALDELTAKFEKKKRSAPSPYAVPATNPSGNAAAKGVEVNVDPDQLGPILHHVALADTIPDVQNVNEHVFFKENP